MRIAPEIPKHANICILLKEPPEILFMMAVGTYFHLLERNDELSQFLSFRNRQQTHAIWYSYSLFHDQNFCIASEM